MKLSGFSIGTDCISVEMDGKAYDLHNEFDFVGMNYYVTKRTAELVWSRSDEARFAPIDAIDLRLCFEEVSLLRVHERDPEIPYSEDTCLESLGFILASLEDPRIAYSLRIPSDEVGHMNFCFLSGARIRILASRVTLRVSGTSQNLA